MGVNIDLTDIYKIQMTEKIRPLISKTTEKIGHYGLFPAQQDNWIKNTITYNLHLVRMKIFDKELVRIDTINDLRESKNNLTGCDVVASYVYHKKFSDIGKILDKSIKRDTQNTDEACF